MDLENTLRPAGVTNNANGIAVSIVVPIIVFNIYLISAFVFFLKINFKFYSIYAVLHLLLTTAMWFLLFFYLSHWFTSLFNVIVIAGGTFMIAKEWIVLSDLL